MSLTRPKDAQPLSTTLHSWDLMLTLLMMMFATPLSAFLAASSTSVLSIKVASMMWTTFSAALCHSVSPLSLRLDAAMIRTFGVSITTTPMSATKLLPRIQPSHCTVSLLIISYDDNNRYLGPNYYNQGLQITFPITSNSARNFQLVVNVLCSYNEVSPVDIPFSMDVSVDSVDGIEILSVTGSSVYGKNKSLL